MNLKIVVSHLKTDFYTHFF